MEYFHVLIKHIVIFCCFLTASTDDREQTDAVIQTLEMPEMEQSSSTPASPLAIQAHKSGLTIRSSKRKKDDDAPTKTKLKKRLTFKLRETLQ